MVKSGLTRRRVDHLRPHQITARGLSRTFQISRNLAEMTVLENVICQSRIGGWRDLLKPAMSQDEIDKAFGILEFLGITRIANEDGSNLSFGQKKLMDLAALLMSDPKIILLDEPAGGVNPTLLEEIVGHIRKLNDSGLTVLIVEHNMELIMRLSHHVVVMAQGRVIAEGTPEEIQKDPCCPGSLSRRRCRRHGMSALLEVKGLVAGYDEGPAILNGAELSVQPGKVHCIIGPNGAGKSTLLKAIVGMLRIREGEVRFKGESLKGLRPRPDIAKRNLLRPARACTVPENDGARKSENGRIFTSRQVRPRKED